MNDFVGFSLIYLSVVLGAPAYIFVLESFRPGITGLPHIQKVPFGLFAAALLCLSITVALFFAMHLLAHLFP